MSTLLFTVTGLLIVPFVKVYTAQITDADYEAPLFAALICLAYFLSSIRNCNYTLIRAAGHYRQTQAASLIEAVTNLSLSIVCVFRFGLIGVAFGTVAATAFFVVYEMIYFSRNIVFVRKTHYLETVCDRCAHGGSRHRRGNALPDLHRVAALVAAAGGARVCRVRGGEPDRAASVLSGESFGREKTHSSRHFWEKSC